MVAPAKKLELVKVIRDTLKAAKENNFKFESLDYLKVIRCGDRTIQVVDEGSHVSFSVRYDTNEAALRAAEDLMLNMPIRYHGNVIAFEADRSKQAVQESLSAFLRLGRYN